MARNNSTKGSMTTREAGRLGGERTSETHGRDFYSKIGKKGGSIGGPRVRELIRRGKNNE